MIVVVERVAILVKAATLVMAATLVIDHVSPWASDPHGPVTHQERVAIFFTAAMTIPQQQVALRKEGWLELAIQAYKHGRF